MTVVPSNDSATDILGSTNSYVKLIRIVGVFFRFYNNIKEKSNRQTKPLSSTEMRKAETSVVLSHRGCLLSVGRNLGGGGRYNRQCSLKNINYFQGVNLHQVKVYLIRGFQLKSDVKDSDLRSLERVTVHLCVYHLLLEGYEGTSPHVGLNEPNPRVRLFLSFPAVASNSGNAYRGCYYQLPVRLIGGLSQVQTRKTSAS